MKDKMLEQRIQQSLNAELSGLNTTSWQRDQYFENATGGYKVKRKMTYSLVLAIVLLLIAATAAAIALELEVDHRYGSETKHDNRKYNLRICTRGENARNKEHKPKEDSCCIGVVKDKKTNKWVAQIGVNGKTIRLGRYVNLDDAIQARKEGEELYFGKWSYDNSRC